MNLLSKESLAKFDYVKTKQNVLEHLSDLILIKYKYMNIMPPSIAVKLFDVNVQSTNLNKSSVESYIVLKDEYERIYKTKLEEIEKILSTLSPYERTFFKGHLINGELVATFTHQFKCGIDKVNQIKESSVIKFALILGIAVEK